ncbi:MAG: bifunctional precorrin-2 dehydrogenase/sirohydrochlorin ferrochelatase [Ktedonobacteraceae bacterium]
MFRGKDNMPKYYPIMLDIRGCSTIVIGGDPIAAEKATALSASGATVTVLSPEFCHELLLQAERKRVTLWQKAYERGDLEGALLVIAATNDQKLIAAVYAETKERNQLVNIVDVPEYCSFIIPSILRREQLTIAVSTEGASPGLAKRIRQGLEELFPLAYGSYLRLASVARTHLRKHGVSYVQRDDFFGEYYASNILAKLDNGSVEQATEETSNLLKTYNIAVSGSALKVELEEKKNYVNQYA